ncbi:hypothetical protein C8J57DRAFT_1319556 [Mycena rebaudengoi]|nr:hypothetical protein C8J57DRAFT_1319556 [Mycena rebaudengoi]
MNFTIYVPKDHLDFLWEQMSMQLYETCASAVIYVISTVFLAAAIFILSRRKASGTNILLVACCIMLSLSTILIFVDAAALSAYIQACRAMIIKAAELGLPLERVAPHVPELSTYDALVKTQRIVFCIDNFVAELVFLYRCYVIWNGRLTVLILPGLLILTTLGAACVVSFTQIIPPIVPLVLSMASNTVLILLTAGRIWWMQREASYLDTEKVSFKTRYTLAIAIIVESGALYILLAFVTIFVTATYEMEYTLAAITQGVAQQAVNLIPALTIVRVGLGRSVHETIQTNTKSNSKEPGTRGRLPRLTFARPVLDSTPGVSVIHITPIEESEAV